MNQGTAQWVPLKRHPQRGLHRCSSRKVRRRPPPAGASARTARCSARSLHERTAPSRFPLRARSFPPLPFDCEHRTSPNHVAAIQTRSARGLSRGAARRRRPSNPLARGEHSPRFAWRPCGGQAHLRASEQSRESPPAMAQVERATHSPPLPLQTPIELLVTVFVTDLPAKPDVYRVLLQVRTMPRTI